MANKYVTCKYTYVDLISAQNQVFTLVCKYKDFNYANKNSNSEYIIDVRFEN